MRKACRGMLFAAGLLLMGTGFAWAQAPTIHISAVNHNVYVVTFTEALTNSPATTDFAVKFGETSVAVTGITANTIDGATSWIVTLAAHLAPGEFANIAYTKPASNPPQDSDGNHLASFTQTRVTQSSWSSATIEDAYTQADGEWIIVNFSVLMQTAPKPDVDRFSATVDGVAADLTSLILRNETTRGPSKGQLGLELAQPVQALQSVTVSYNRLTGDTEPLLDGFLPASLIQGFTRDVTNKVGPTPTIDLVRIVSAPTYDADSDGVRDTFVRGDKILVDVEYSEPVSVTGTPRLRLQLGDDATPANNRKQVNFESELHGGRTLRFAYTVAASDADATGVWIETAGTNKTVVFLPSGATIKSATNDVAAELTRTGLPTAGEGTTSLTKVDGSKTASDRGPLPTGATVNGATLEVTYDKALDTSVATSELLDHFSVQGTSLSGGNRNAYQHPTNASFSAGNNQKLVLTLGDPARAGDTITLTYKLEAHKGPLKDTSSNMAPAFIELAVTNNTAGTPGPAPSRASVRGRTLQLVFDGDLDEDSAPAGSAFLVETSDFDYDRRSIAGTGMATVSGAVVTVTLDENEDAVGADDLVEVSYTVPSSNPLQNAGGDDVLAFERFRVETVYDGTGPVFTGAEAMQTSISPDVSKAVIYFDEPLDTGSVPGTGDFSLLSGGNLATISSVAVEGDAVTLTLNQALPSGTVLSLGYTTETNTILDLAGNGAEGFAHAITAVSAAVPMLQTSGTDAPAADGASLTLTYDVPLNPAKVPAADRYTLHYQLRSGETNADREEYRVGVTAVAVRAKKVVLQLSSPGVTPCDPEPTVSYAQKTGGPNVQGIDGRNVAAISHQVVANSRKSGCTRAQGVSGNSGGQGKSVTLKFQRTLDTGRALQASVFRLAGAAAPSVASAAYTADAAGVALRLDRALASGETVEARYERPVGEPGLWDTDGKQIADFSGVTVTNDEPVVPAVTGVEVVSDAGENDTYGLGEAIRIRLTLSEAVEVTGAPRLQIDMDPADWGEKWAAYESGGGTDSLTFSHTVVEPNFSTEGIAVLADTLEANGGAIRSAATEADAVLSHDGLDHDPDHKVDWQVEPAPPSPPTATGVAVSSGPRTGDTYRLGETIRVTVSFNEAVDVTGSPRLQIDMDPGGWGEKWAVYESGGGTASLTFAYEVVDPNVSTQGIAVLADTLQLNGGTIRSAGTEADADLSHDGLAHDPSHKVDSEPEAVTVTGVVVSSRPAADDTYKLGETIRVTVTFSEAVEVTGAPRLQIDMDPGGWGEKWTAYESGGGTDSLVFAYTVVEPNASTQGIAVLASTLELNGGTIRSAATEADAELAHAGLGHDPAHKVDWEPETVTVTGVVVSSSPPRKSTYVLGDSIRIQVNFSGAVDVTGAPRLKLKMDPGYGEKWVSYEAGSGTASLTFAYEVVEPNNSPNGIAVLANSLALNGGTIEAASGGSVELAHTGLGHDSNHKVDWELDVTPPEFVKAEVNGRVAKVFFDEDLAQTDTSSFTALTSWAIDVSPGSFHPNSISISGSVVTLNMGTAMRPGQTLKVLYEPEGGIADLAGNEVANSISEPAENLTTAAMSVADARVEEAEGATLDFVVSLDVAPGGSLTVDYTTADGTATAGEDYTATSGTLTFGADEQTKTIQVAVLDDAHDEGEETMTLRFSNPSGMRLNRTEATGTIENTDLMPAALLARFGRATAEQVVTHIEERMAAPRRRGFRARLAGRELQPGSERDFALGFLTQLAQPMGTGPAGAAAMGGAVMGGAVPMAVGSHAAGPGAGAFGAGPAGMTGAMGMTGLGGGATGMTGLGTATGAMGMAGQHAPMGAATAMGGYGPADGMHGGGLFGSMSPGGGLFSNSEFELNRESRGGMLSLWSSSSRSHFRGMEDALSLDGDVRTTMIGADYARGPLTVGLSVGRTMGLGGYSGPSGGRMTTSMTGFYPWVGYQVNDRVSVWGVTGYGTGALSLTPDGASALETGVSMAMSAVGTRGELVGSRATGGFALAFKADAMWVGAASDLLEGPTGRLNASEAGVTRLRTALEGSRGFILGGGRLSLTPSVEVGLRRDGGDAETGAGMDVGGGLAFSDTVSGLSLDVRVRTLVVHQAEGFAERGMSLSFGWDPAPSSPLGLTAKLAPSWGGKSRGGAESLWGNQMAYGMNSHQMYGSGDRIDAEVGYGLPVGARLVGTPRVGLATSQYGRDYRFGYGLRILESGSVSFEAGVDAQRRESPMQGGTSNGFLGRATLGW